MKQRNTIKTLSAWLSAVVLALGLQALQAGVPEDMKITLIFTDGGTGIVGSADEPVARQLFLLDPSQGVGGMDPIGVMIVVENVGTESYYTRLGFSDEHFEYYIEFIDPDGNKIISNPVRDGDVRINVDETDEAGDEIPPYFCRDSFGKVIGDGCLPAEILNGTATGDALRRYIKIEDIRALYPLDKTGVYTARVVIGFRTFNPADVLTYNNAIPFFPLGASSLFNEDLFSNTTTLTIVGDYDADNYPFPVVDSRVSTNTEVDCDDRDSNVNPGITAEILGNQKDDDCDPATLDYIVPPEVATGTASITVDLHVVGAGNYPNTGKQQLDGVSINAYDKLHPCVASYPSSWKYYDDIYNNCSAAITASASSSGTEPLDLALPVGDHIIIGDYRSAPGALPIYIGRNVTIEENVTEKVYMQVIQKVDGKKSPAKSYKRTGSLLLVIEPEYVEWDSTEELYPIVFESIGDWAVTTSVEPPEGFVADADALTADVNTEIEAIQFTITDVGSSWVPTTLEHTIKHKDKTEKIKSKIDIKLSKEMLKELKKRYGKKKKLTYFGEEGGDAPDGGKSPKPKKK